MKSNCKKFSDSISPLKMPKSNREIKELLECLKVDIEAYVSSVETETSVFVNHFKNSVLPLLEKKGMLQSFKSQLTKYVRVLEVKNITIFHNLRVSSKKLSDDLDQINKMAKYDSTEDTKLKHYLVESIKLIYVDFSNFLIVASQIFFALEFYCKILCALGCAKFALKVARSELIQHNMCWKQLKRLSDRNSNYCETCIVSDTCNSEIDFGALSRIYAYSVKIRQIADYTPKLVSGDIYKSGLIQPPAVYFTYLESLLRENSLFYKCLADVIPDITGSNIPKNLMNELRSPFLWGDEERLKEALNKNEDDDFYNYLLGRFYYKKRNFGKAIRFLEKAKKMNPKNADVWDMLADIYDITALTKKSLKKSIEYLRKARDLEPSNHETLVLLGVAELAVGDYSYSVENLIKASEYAPTEFIKCGIFAVLSEAYKMKGIIAKSKYYLRKSNKISKTLTNDTLKWLRNYLEIKTKLL